MNTNDGIPVIYDLFIAYHGTYDKNGTYQEAKKIADYLTALRYKVYLHQYSYDINHPEHASTPFTETWERVRESRCFLLVVNDSVPRKSNYSLGNEVSSGQSISELRKEVDIFYDLVKKRNRDIMDFNWYYCGNQCETIPSQENFLSSLYPLLANGNNTLLYNSFTYQNIFKWLNERLSNTEKSNQSYHQSQQVEKYTPPYSNEPFFCVIDANDFKSAYNRCKYYISRGEKNLIVNLSLSVSDFLYEFYDPNAYEKAKILRETEKDNNKNGSPYEFSIYHGDYIIIDNHGELKNGYKYVIDELKSKKSSRRALISLLSTNDIVGSGNKNIPSFALAQFQILNEDLLATEYFRAMDIKEFMPINLAEAYIMCGNIIKEIGGIKRVFLSLHIFDAYVSQTKQLYIPIMDRNSSEIQVVSALNSSFVFNDKNGYYTIIELLKDKLSSRVYNYTKGIDLILKFFKSRQNSDSELIKYLEQILDYGIKLENLYSKSNDPQENILITVDNLLKKLIEYFEKLTLCN